MRHHGKLVLGLAIVALACGGSGEKQPPSGGVELRTSMSALAADARVLAVTYTARWADGTTTTGSMRNSAADRSGTWSVLFERVPAGVANFKITATGTRRNGSAGVIFDNLPAGANVTVVARTVTNAVAVLQERDVAAAYDDAAPFIRSLVVGLDRTTFGYLLTASAGPAGKSLTYAFSADGGSFAPGDATQTTAAGSVIARWTAPGAGTFTITLSVTDGRGVPAVLTVRIVVVPTGDLRLTVDLNTWPAVASMAVTQGNAQPALGDRVEITAIASDADGDPLTFTWSSVCAAAPLFGGPTPAPGGWAATITFTMGQASGTCEVRLDVGDGRGGANTGTLTLTLTRAVVYPPPTFTLSASPAPAWDPARPAAISFDLVPDVTASLAIEFTSALGGTFTPGAGTFAATAGAPLRFGYLPADASAICATRSGQSVDVPVGITARNVDTTPNATYADQLLVSVACP